MGISTRKWMLKIAGSSMFVQMTEAIFLNFRNRIEVSNSLQKPGGSADT